MQTTAATYAPPPASIKDLRDSLVAASEDARSALDLFKQQMDAFNNHLNRVKNNSAVLLENTKAISNLEDLLGPSIKGAVDTAEKELRDAQAIEAEILPIKNGLLSLLGSLDTGAPKPPRARARAPPSETKATAPRSTFSNADLGPLIFSTETEGPAVRARMRDLLKQTSVITWASLRAWVDVLDADNLLMYLASRAQEDDDRYGRYLFINATTLVSKNLSEPIPTLSHSYKALFEGYVESRARKDLSLDTSDNFVSPTPIDIGFISDEQAEKAVRAAETLASSVSIPLVDHEEEGKRYGLKVALVVLGKDGNIGSEGLIELRQNKNTGPELFGNVLSGGGFAKIAAMGENLADTYVLCADAQRLKAITPYMIGKQVLTPHILAIPQELYSDETIDALDRATHGIPDCPLFRGRIATQLIKSRKLSATVLSFVLPGLALPSRAHLLDSCKEIKEKRKLAKKDRSIDNIDTKRVKI